VLGKAVYEGVLVEPELADWVLNLLSGNRNGVHDLQSLDADVYHSLMRLKHMPAEVIDTLGLAFTFTNLHGQEVDLAPDGGAVGLTRDNRHEYIRRVADFKLNQELLPQVNALAEGFNTVIDTAWIRMFSSPELQALIGGADRDFDVRELRQHVVYAGGYWATDEYVGTFWRVVEEDLTAKQRGLLLKFITSCPRPPLSGFGALQPKVTIYKVKDDVDRLPSASTCVNLFKLPQYSSREVLYEKLVLAIESGTGFELS
jgi:ubiquitin-protein ligase E3 C